jgi:hypothetical protein
MNLMLQVKRNRLCHGRTPRCRYGFSPALLWMHLWCRRLRLRLRLRLWRRDGNFWVCRYGRLQTRKLLFDTVLLFEGF